MTKVTKEMIAAAHDITMRHKIVLGHELLTEIYQAMNAKQEFVGLTDEDKQIAFDDTQEGGGFWEFADAIEATLRKKNHE